ncbi:MAG: hypothetical protein GX422_15710 [Deltaproteobacteria bacterium]|nr:hypothetical protein [Deltaproteobacteria bacterium]
MTCTFLPSFPSFIATAHIKRKGFSPDFFEFLARYSWPGNVRELVNAIERAIAAARHEPTLFPKHLPTYIRVQLARASVSGRETPGAGDGRPGIQYVLPQLGEIRESAIALVEQRYLRELVTQTKGDIQRACRIAGLSRSRLYALLKKYQIRTAV